jgi:hypothetical protein
MGVIALNEIVRNQAPEISCFASEVCLLVPLRS